MTKDEKKLREQFIALRDKGGLNGSMIAQVVRVNSDETIDVLLDEIEIYNVRLRAVINGNDNKIIITPKDNSNVYISPISPVSNNQIQYVVTAFSEIEKLEVVDGSKGVQINLSDGEVIINNGDNKGVVKVVELVSQLNTLEQRLNTVYSTLNGITVPSTGMVFAPLFPLPSISQTTVSNLENPKFKH